MKEMMNEDTRCDVIELLGKIAPHWKHKNGGHCGHSAWDRSKRRKLSEIHKFSLQEDTTEMAFGG